MIPTPAASAYPSQQSDNELEAPQQHVEQEDFTLVQQPAVSIAGVSADAWPSLTAGQLAGGGSQKRSSTATFSRSLFGGKLKAVIGSFWLVGCKQRAAPAAQNRMPQH